MIYLKPQKGKIIIQDILPRKIIIQNTRDKEFLKQKKKKKEFSNTNTTNTTLEENVEGSSLTGKEANIYRKGKIPMGKANIKSLKQASIQISLNYKNNYSKQ